MAAIMISSPATASSRPSIPSSIAYSYDVPKLTFHSFPKSSIFFPSVTLQPAKRTKPRFLNVVVSAAKMLSEKELVAVPSEPDAISGIFPKDSGVYAVYDGNGGCNLSNSRGTSPPVDSTAKNLSLSAAPPSRSMRLKESWKSWVKEHFEATGELPPARFRQQSKKKKRDKKEPTPKLIALLERAVVEKLNETKYTYMLRALNNIVKWCTLSTQETENIAKFIARLKREMKGNEVDTQDLQ